MSQYLFDGVKASPIFPTGYLGENGWNWGGSGTAPLSPNVRRKYETVGLLYSCVHLRAKALKKVPWTIVDVNNETIWQKDDPVPEQLKFLKDLPRLLYKTEAALVLGSQAYWHKERNRVRTTAIKWLAPGLVEPFWDEVEGIKWFDRRLGAETLRLPPTEVVYIWYQHPMFEILRDASPAEAAMAAAGVLYHIDMFTAGFFERGAIKAMILGVSGNPPKNEMERIKRWWERSVNGVRNAFKTEVVNADTIKPVVVGEGLAELTNVDLTSEKRNDIAITLGIPLSMVFSDAANYATSKQDEQNFYNNTIVPDCEIISEQVNEQLLEPYGYQLVFQPEQMDVFQTDEVEKSNSFKVYVDTGLPHSLAAEMVGLDLPNGMKYEELDEAVQKVKEQNMQNQQALMESQAALQGEGPAASNGGTADDEQSGEQGDRTPANEDEGEDEEEEIARRAEIRRFKSWVAKRKHPDPDDFHSDILSQLEKLDLFIDAKGGPGSGNWGHAGRSGKEGGSVGRGVGSGVKVRDQSRKPEKFFELEPTKVNQRREIHQRWLEENGIDIEKSRQIIRGFAEDGIPSMRLEPESLEKALEQGYFTNGFESGTGTLAEGTKSFRRDLEEHAFGVPKDADPSQRPTYGYLKIDDHSGRAEVYGGVEITFKDSIKDSSTMTIGDSLRAHPMVDGGSVSGTPIRNADIEGIPRIHNGFNRVVDGSRSRRDFLLDLDYVEMQMPGRISFEYIEKVTDMRGHLSSKPDLVKRLRDRGIRVEGVYE